MKRKIFTTLLTLVIPFTFFAQANYGFELAGGTSKMKTANIHENWGEFYSGGLFLNYTDKYNFIYETGMYYDFRNLKLDGFPADYDATTVNILYKNINDLKVPITVGLKVNNGIFSTVNLTVQGGMFFSCGLFGSTDIMYSGGNFETIGNLGTKTNHIYSRESLSAVNPDDENAPDYEYYPLKRFDAGSLLKIGLNYKDFSVNINTETGWVNLNSHYDKFIKSHKLYLSVTYSLGK